MPSAFSFPSRLYAILDVDSVRSIHRDPLDVLARWLDAGVTLVQLRAKLEADAELLSLADEVCQRCHAASATAIVNDRADIATMAGADGVHVGQEDLAPDLVRQLMGPRWIGLSTHTTDQVEAGCAAPVDYLAIGPVFGTRTKPSANAVVGLTGVARAAARAHAAGLPIVAIGGITLETARSVLDAGADAVAVISDLLTGAPGPRARQYLQTV